MKAIDKILKFFFPDPPQKFRIGQDVTPTERPQWIARDAKDKYLGPGMGPAFGEIVKVKSYVNVDSTGWRINITKYDGNFREMDFAPVIATHELAELLQEAKIPIE